MFSGIDHVGIAVRDLVEAKAYHTRVLGMHVVHEETNDDQGVVEVMLAATPDGPAQVQLVAPVRPDSAVARFLERRGPGLHHIAYATGDVDEATAALQERGTPVLYESARRGTRGSRINFVHPEHAGGVLVELVQPCPCGAPSLSHDHETSSGP